MCDPYTLPPSIKARHWIRNLPEVGTISRYGKAVEQTWALIAYHQQQIQLLRKQADAQEAEALSRVKAELVWTKEEIADSVEMVSPEEWDAIVRVVGLPHLRPDLDED